MKPFKAGATEQNSFLISIDSWPIGRCDNGSPPYYKHKFSLVQNLTLYTNQIKTFEKKKILRKQY